jgi:hypothetical protein
MDAIVPPKYRFLQEPHGVLIPEDGILHSHRRGNLESYTFLKITFHRIIEENTKSIPMCQDDMWIVMAAFSDTERNTKQGFTSRFFELAIYAVVKTLALGSES